MWPKIGTLALVASLIPLGACAQSHDAGGGPSPEMKAKMDDARASAKTASLAALSDDHKTKVQAIVDAFDASGSALTVTDASQQIDAVLGKDEATAVLLQQQKMRDDMRAAFQANGGGPGGPGGSQGGPGNGGPGNGGPGGPAGPGSGGGPGGFGRHRAPDAGRFILQVDASQDRYREAMRAERAANTQH